MTTMRTSLASLAALTGIMGAYLLLTLAPYGGNITALFHADNVVERMNPLPSGFVVLQEPAYDGAQYYQIARLIPAFLSTNDPHRIAAHGPGSYAYQRILLPLLAAMFAMGYEPALPYAFLAINITALLGAAWILQRMRGGSTLGAFAIALCPAALIGLHFSLAEPLAMVLITAAMALIATRRHIPLSAMMLLSLLVLTKEVMILFIATLGITLLLKRHWNDASALLIPALVFVSWHIVIYVLFGDIPFLMSSAKSGLPLTGMLPIIMGQNGYDAKTLSSIALMVLFVLPACCLTIAEVWRHKNIDVLTGPLAMMLLVMLIMPPLIWGSITSIGRVIVPVYPLALMLASRSEYRFAFLLEVTTIVVGVTTGVGLALTVHPFTIS